MPKIKVTINRSIEMKFCLNHYTHKSMPDGKFESGILPSVGDMN